MGELRQLNEQNKLAIWAERVTECRNSGQSVLAWCKEHGICSQTYYKWWLGVRREYEKISVNKILLGPT